MVHSMQYLLDMTSCLTNYEKSLILLEKLRIKSLSRLRLDGFKNGNEISSNCTVVASDSLFFFNLRDQSHLAFDAKGKRTPDVKSTSFVNVAKLAQFSPAGFSVMSRLISIVFVLKSAFAMRGGPSSSTGRAVPLYKQSSVFSHSTEPLPFFFSYSIVTTKEQLQLCSVTAAILRDAEGNTYTISPAPFFLKIASAWSGPSLQPAKQSKFCGTDKAWP